MPPYKTIELEERANVGDTNSFNARYFADGKRIPREKFSELKRESIRTDCFYNVNRAGVQSFYCTVRIALPELATPASA